MNYKSPLNLSEDNFELYISSTDGSFHLIRGSKVVWNRPEFLAECKELLAVEKEVVKKKAHDFDTSSFDLVEYGYRLKHNLASILARFLKSRSIDSIIHGKNLVFLSETGKVAAVDSNNGHIIWSRYFPEYNLQRLFQFKSSPNELIILAHAGNNSIILKLDGRTGAALESKASEDLRYPFLSYYAELIDLPGKDAKLILSDGDQLSVYPNRDRIEGLEPKVYLYRFSEDSKVLHGYAISKRTPELEFKSYSLWNLTLPESESMVLLNRGDPEANHAASLGRVLGDRSVMYKYLNPNLISFVTLSKTKLRMTVYVVDSVSGSIQLRIPHQLKALPPLETINLLQFENSLIYTFWKESEESTNTEIVVTEFFEYDTPDRRINSTKLSSFDSHKLHAISRSFSFARHVNALGVSKTLNGITTREVLFALDGNQILGINRRLLDPRRPIELTAMHKEEGLVPYYPELNINFKDMLTYFKPIYGVKNLKGFPTAYESTSLIVGYGMDLFCTTVSPSNSFDMLSSEFNYIGLVITIALLSATIVWAKDKVTLFK